MWEPATLAQKKAMLKASVKIAHGSYGAILSDRARRYSKAATAHMQSLNQVIFGMTTMGDTGLEEGNQGQNWNFMSAVCVAVTVAVCVYSL